MMRVIGTCIHTQLKYVHTHKHTHTYACISWILIVPLQTRDALNEEVTKQGLNIIHFVSFPSDQNPQTFVQKLQVGGSNKHNTILVLL